MTSASREVFLIVDREFGQKLASIFSSSGPIWIVDTPTNRVVVERLRSERPANDLTIFRDQPSLHPEEIVISETDMIDLHHGLYVILNVIGTPLSEHIKEELLAHGFVNFTKLDIGFRAERSSDAGQ